MTQPPISPEAREKMVAGQHAARHVRAYLEALRLMQPTRGRPSTKTSDDLQIAVLRLEAQYEAESDVLKQLKILPRLTEAREAVKAKEAEEKTRANIDLLAKTFAEHAAAYGENHGIRYEHWLQMGVPPKVLADAGIENRG